MYLVYTTTSQRKNKTHRRIIKRNANGKQKLGPRPGLNRGPRTIKGLSQSANHTTRPHGLLWLVSKLFSYILDEFVGVYSAEKWIVPWVKRRRQPSASLQPHLAN